MGVELTDKKNMSDSDEAPIETKTQKIIATQQPELPENDVNDENSENDKNLPPKKRRRNRKLKNNNNNPEFTPPPSTNSNLTTASSPPTVEKSDYDLKLEELLKRAENAENEADASLGKKKQTKTIVRKRKSNVVKRFKCVDTEVDQKTAYGRIIRSSSQFQSALELKQNMLSDKSRNEDPLARFKQNQRKFLLK